MHGGEKENTNSKKPTSPTKKKDVMPDDVSGVADWLFNAAQPGERLSDALNREWSLILAAVLAKAAKR